MKEFGLPLVEHFMVIVMLLTGIAVLILVKDSVGAVDWTVMLSSILGYKVVAVVSE